MKLHAKPQQKIVVTHGVTDYTLSSDVTATIVRRHENGFGTATVIFDDRDARLYSDFVDAGDAIEIAEKDSSETTYVRLLEGTVRRVTPIISSTGNLLKAECDGAGIGLNVMMCGEEYGTESSNSALDTIKTIIENVTDGIVPLWVNKVLGDSGVSSGFNYTTAVETIAGSISYLYFPFKPAGRSINDVCDVVQGIKGTNAGPHWLLVHHTDGNDYLCVATVGNHGAPASTYWPTWWNTDAAGSTITEGVDFVGGRFEKLAAEANYVLYHGKTIKPIDLDKWTENNAASWGTAGGYTTITNDASGKVGAAIKISSSGGIGVIENVFAGYPSTADLALDITEIGGSYNVPIVHFWAKCDAQMWAADPNLTIGFTKGALGVGGGTWAAQANIQSILTAAATWTEVTFPIGPNWEKAVRDFPSWLNFLPLAGITDWDDIDTIQFSWLSTADGDDLWIDNYYISGYVLRGARQNAAFTTAAPCKMVLIDDDVAKDDTWDATDDSGTIARLTYAEYLRLSSTPTVGTVTIPIANNIMPGQKIHIHAKKKMDGTFKIDADFRVTNVTHNLLNSGFTTELDVTSDVVNARPRSIPSKMNVALKAVRPEFQDRQASSIKARNIDITQSVLEKKY